MAIYTKISRRDVLSIERKFNLGKIISFNGIKKGIENTNYLLRTKNKKYINSKKDIAYVTQTTLSVDDTKNIIKILKKNFPNIKDPIKEDICYATTNRQAAVKNIASKCDMFFVIGSKNSSNSLRLVEVAKQSGCKHSQLFHTESVIPLNKINECRSIGISSGASAPEILVQNFINELKSKFKIKTEEIEIIKEDIVFKTPGKLN